MDFLNWIVTNGNQLGAFIVVVIVLVALIYGAQQPEPKYDKHGDPIDDRWGRPWWVVGWYYKDCVRAKIAAEREVKTYVQGIKDRVKELEAEREQRR